MPLRFPFNLLHFILMFKLHWRDVCGGVKLYLGWNLFLTDDICTALKERPPCVGALISFNLPSVTGTLRHAVDSSSSRALQPATIILMMINLGIGPYIPVGNPQFCFRLHLATSVCMESESDLNGSLEQFTAYKAWSWHLTENIERESLGNQGNNSKLGKKAEVWGDWDVRFV